MATCKTKLRVCLLQFAAKEGLTETLTHLDEMVSKAVNDHQPDIISLPELFNFSYCTELPILEAMAESISYGATFRRLSTLSKQFSIYIVGGLVERDGDNLYNTAAVYDPNGELIAKHRKVHLSNAHSDVVDIVEVDRFQPGNEITTFEVNGFKCGLAICYDAFLDEFVKIYGREGCDLMIFPVAFHASYGDTYWELIQRARALDNQMFVAAVSPARNEQASYVVYGYSMIVDPLGKVLTKAGISEEIVFHEIDSTAAQKIRTEVPVMSTSRRVDVYKKYSDY
ncbi:omega-amidase NIT2-like [Sitodiplosis mosellana]|uniref:omega-amidase NIT2-like n=1 Tax=Sitodiplosis mosellana TaxID=263140 RepID=UPI002444E676|nr:omega-amidase NIT2-like [Sitodiplosis mosellana]XP_055314538.1 omega-amidase NIT2-like [Sitodiplosis mosellana]